MLYTFVPTWAQPPLCSISTLPPYLAAQAKQKYRGRRIETFMASKGWRGANNYYPRVRIRLIV